MAYGLKASSCPLNGKIVKEFAYKLSIPFTDILNASFTDEGIVPGQWGKKGIVVPVPNKVPLVLTSYGKFH